MKLKLRIVFLMVFLFMFSSVFVYADYDVTSKYQKTEFNTSKWVQAHHNVTLNITQEFYQLEFTPTLYENFSSWIEVDVPDRLSQTSSNSIFTGLLRSDNVYLYKSWNIKDWNISYNFYIYNITLSGAAVLRCDLVALTSALGSESQLRAANEEMIGLNIRGDTGSNDFDVHIHEETNGVNFQSGFVNDLKVNTKYYVSMYKSGTTFNCKIFTNMNKTNKIFDQTLTLHNDWNLAYINCPNSLGFAGNHQISGYVEKLYQDKDIGKYTKKGVIYTNDLLENITQKSVMLGLNSSAAADTQALLYASSDNVTWVELLDNNGLGTLGQYSEVLYDYSSLFVRLNLSTADPLLSPYVDELFYFHTYECAVSSETKPYVFITLFTIIGMILGYKIDRT